VRWGGAALGWCQSSVFGALGWCRLGGASVLLDARPYGGGATGAPPVPGRGWCPPTLGASDLMETAKEPPGALGWCQSSVIRALGWCQSFPRWGGAAGVVPEFSGGWTGSRLGWAMEEVPMRLGGASVLLDARPYGGGAGFFRLGRGWCAGGGARVFLRCAVGVPEF
jgi:hypothetical protein